MWWRLFLCASCCVHFLACSELRRKEERKKKHLHTCSVYNHEHKFYMPDKWNLYNQNDKRSTTILSHQLISPFRFEGVVHVCVQICAVGEGFLWGFINLLETESVCAHMLRWLSVCLYNPLNRPSCQLEAPRVRSHSNDKTQRFYIHLIFISYLYRGGKVGNFLSASFWKSDLQMQDSWAYLLMQPVTKLPHTHKKKLT